MAKVSSSKSAVSRSIRKMLVQGKIVHVSTYNVPQKIRGIESATAPLRFLGIDGDNGKEIIWVFAWQWKEDGFPVARIERIPDAVMARAEVTPLSESDLREMGYGRQR